MKQLNLSEIVQAFCDEPKTIAERLAILGYSRGDLAGKIPEDALSLSVYGTSFLKFLHENAAKIETGQQGTLGKNLSADLVNPFEDENLTLEQRFEALDISKNNLLEMFSKEVLTTVVSADQFQDFIIQNKEKFLNNFDKLVATGGNS